MEHTTKVNAVDEELQEIQKIVDKVKSRSDVKERYMTLQEVIDYEKRDSYEEGVEFGIQGTIATCKSLHQDKSQTKAHLISHFQLTEDKADEYLNLYW